MKFPFICNACGVLHPLVYSVRECVVERYVEWIFDRGGGELEVQPVAVEALIGGRGRALNRPTTVDDNRAD